MIKLHRFGLFLVVSLLFCFTACEIVDDDPDADLRDRFVGTWRFDETEVKSNQAFYNVDIAYDPSNSSQVVLTNFANVGSFHSAYGIVTEDRITIPAQTVASLTISGIGNLTTNSTMTWTYAVNDGADLISYAAIAIKQ
ncbi:MAG: hypothetical protein IH597_11285 [Bacteroidales bacterium]|nr:hypothetical protein [Bacteroidales bacterium]